MSAENLVNDIELSLEYGRDSAAEMVDELGYEQFWEDRDEAIKYANRKLSETNWKLNFDSKESAVRYYIISEQSHEPETPDGPLTTSSPF